MFVLKNLLSYSGNVLKTRNFSLCTTYLATKQSLEEKIGLPPKPKRPLTPYFRYMKQIRPSVVAENPNANVIEIVRIIANKWKTIDDTSKKQLEDEYKKEQISYLEKYSKYEKKLTENQKRDLKQLKEDMVEAKERRALKKRIKELGRPKKPLSAFFKFILHEKSISPCPKNMPYTDWIKKVTEKWVRLSDAEKEKYKNESKKDFEKYKEEYSKWEHKMIRLGHIDVVRQSALIDPEIKLKETNS